MKRIIKSFIYFSFAAASITIFFIGCKKTGSGATNQQESLTDYSNVIADLKAIRAMGFDPMSAKSMADGGYLVEGDVVLTRASLNRFLASGGGPSGQYSTLYKIAIPDSGRTINIGMYVSDSTLAKNVGADLDSTIADLSGLGLPLKFKYVSDTSKADVIVEAVDTGGETAYGVTLAMDGQFVDPHGNPGRYVILNSNPAADLIDQSQVFITQILDHEFGHCIGLRHTDYQDRLYGYVLEGGNSPTYANQQAALKSTVESLDPYFSLRSKSAQTQELNEVLVGFIESVGDSASYSIATHLYGTPVSPTYASKSPASDPNSLMLGYIQTPHAHPFDSYDNIALFDLYGNAKQIKFIQSNLSVNGGISGKLATVSAVLDSVRKIR
jgi:Dual-action HEIGH metallo-peptidase